MAFVGTDDPRPSSGQRRRLGGQNDVASAAKPSLPDQVRHACAEVTSDARRVSINEDRLTAYADGLPPATAPTADTSYFYVGELEETVAYALTFSTVNFGSGWHPHVRKLPRRSGSITMMSRLTDRFRRHGPLSAEELCRLTAADCAELFHQPLEPPIGELMALFAKALRDFGRYLLESFGGSFLALVEAAGRSAARLAELLFAMELYRDVSLHHGRHVPLLKRAQITSAELAAALGGHVLGRFDDLDRLTVFADNLIPHVLRVEGVLRYDHQLNQRIDAGDLLAPGSEEEVEIRAVAVHAVEQIAARLRAAGRQVSPMDLDYLLWHAGQSPRYKAIPRHRCRCPYY